MKSYYKFLFIILSLISIFKNTTISYAANVQIIGETKAPTPPAMQLDPNTQNELFSFGSTDYVEMLGSGYYKDIHSTKFYTPQEVDETLWSIATKIRPSSDVSVQQMVLAFYRINPSAFSGPNINELIPGIALQIPTIAQIKLATTKQAVDVITEHNKLYKEALAAQKNASAQEMEQNEQSSQNNQSAKKENVSDQYSANFIAAKQIENLKKLLSTRDDQITELEAQVENLTRQIAAEKLANHKFIITAEENKKTIDGLNLALTTEQEDHQATKISLQQKIDELAILQEQYEERIFYNNVLLVALFALVPGALLAFFAIRFLKRRQTEKETTNASATEDNNNAANNTITTIAASTAAVVDETQTRDELDEELAKIQNSGNIDQLLLDDTDLESLDDLFDNIDENGDLQLNDADTTSTDNVEISNNDNGTTITKQTANISNNPTTESEVSSQANNDFDNSKIDEPNPEALNNNLPNDDLDFDLSEDLLNNDEATNSTEKDLLNNFVVHDDELDELLDIESSTISSTEDNIDANTPIIDSTTTNTDNSLEKTATDTNNLTNTDLEQTISNSEQDAIFNMFSNKDLAADTDNLNQDTADKDQIWNDEDVSTAEIVDENWAEQSELENVDLPEQNLMTVDQLINQVDKLDETDNVEDTAKSESLPENLLEIAKDYIASGNETKALEILEKAIASGDKKVRSEAKNMIDAIDNQ